MNFKTFNYQNKKKPSKGPKFIFNKLLLFRLEIVNTKPFQWFNNTGMYVIKG